MPAFRVGWTNRRGVAIRQSAGDGFNGMLQANFCTPFRDTGGRVIGHRREPASYTLAVRPEHNGIHTDCQNAVR